MYTLLIIALVMLSIGFIGVITGGNSDLGVFGIVFMVFAVFLLTHLGISRLTYVHTIRGVYVKEIDVEKFAEDYAWEKPMIQQQQQQQEQTTPDSSSG